MALFPPGKGGGEGVGHGWKGKGVTLHSLSDGNGRPLALISTSAGESEKDQVIPLLNQLWIHVLRGHPKQRPKVLEADKGYDANWLREKLRRLNIRPLIKRRQWKKKRKGRPAEKQKIRWTIERLFGWYQHKFRRLAVRWDRSNTAWQGFVDFGFILIWIGVLVG